MRRRQAQSSLLALACSVALTLPAGGCAHGAGGGSPTTAHAAPQAGSGTRAAQSAEDALDPQVLNLFLQAQMVLQEPDPVQGPDERPRRAAALLQEALSLQPKQAILWRYLAETYSVEGEHAAAAQAAERAIGLDPKDARAHALLGSELRQLGEVQEAEPHLREAARAGLAGESAHLPHYYLYLLQKEQGRSDDALRTLEDWGRALPEDSSPGRLFARLLWDVGRFDEARAAALEALRREPSADEPLRIVLRYHQLDPVAAAESLEEVLRHDWSVPELHRELVSLWSRIGRFDKSIEHLRTLEILDNRDPAARVRQKAELLMRMHRQDEAAALISRTLEGEGGAKADGQLLLLLAGSLEAGGDPAEALATLDRLGAADPEYLAAAARRAEILTKHGEARRALEGVLSARQLAGGGAGAGGEALEDLLRAGVAAALRLDDREAARNLAEELGRVSFREGLLARVDIDRREGELDRAIRNLEAAVQSESNDIALLTALAECLADAGDMSGARKVLDDALARLDRWETTVVGESTPVKALQARQDAASDRVWLLLRRSFLERRALDWAAAEASLRKAMELRAREPDVLNALGYLLAERRERLDEAKQLIAAALDLRPWSPAIEDSMGWVLFGLGDTAGAIEHIERANAWMPGDPEVLEHLGDILRALGRPQDATFRYEEARRGLDPDTATHREVGERLDGKLRDLQAEKPARGKP